MGSLTPYPAGGGSPSPNPLLFLCWLTRCFGCLLLASDLIVGGGFRWQFGLFFRSHAEHGNERIFVIMNIR